MGEDAVTIGEGLAIGLSMWALVAVPLGIMLRDYKVTRATMEFVDKHPEYKLKFDE